MNATAKKAELFDVPATIKVSAKFLSDIIITAIEGGFGTSWWPHVRLIVSSADIDDELREVWKKSGIGADTVAINQQDDMVWNEYLARNVTEGGTITWFEDGVESGEPEEYTLHRLTREKLLKGLSAVLTKYPHLAPPMGTDDDGGQEYDLDAIGADAVIQIALLDELRYG